MIATHFDEKWERDECNKMCDNCEAPQDPVLYNITPACKYIYAILENADKKDINLTLLKLLDAWFKNGDKNLRVQNIEMPVLERQHVERIIAYLFTKGYLQEYKSYTSYATNCYIQKGRGKLLTSDIVIEMPFTGNLNLKVLKKRSFSEINSSVECIEIE